MHVHACPCILIERIGHTIIMCIKYTSIIYSFLYNLDCFVTYRFGPLSKLWCMRFEGRHKQFKQICKRTSFKNIFKTLTESNQRRQAYDIHCNEVFAKVNMNTAVGRFT
jgi:hypothetical protein